MEGAKNDAFSYEEEAKAEAEIWNFPFGFVKMAVAKCAIELGIPEAITSHENPISLPDLSSLLSCEPSRLHRIMRFLVRFQIIKQKPTSNNTTGYVPTPLSRRLIKNDENSFAALILFESNPVMLAPWHFLSNWVKSGRDFPFAEAHGEDVWDYAGKNAGHSEMLNNAMACVARAGVRGAIKGCPKVFDGIGSMVDVGGGNGTTLRMLVKAFPWIKGINFDLPHVICAAPKLDSIQNVGGDMFLGVPKADAVFLMSVLHDWDDEDCIKILKKCREAIPSDKGKVIIVDVVIREEGNVVNEEDDDGKMDYVRWLLDMIMMAHTNRGKERTLKEWDYVLTEAGFKRYNINHVPAIPSVIEAFP